MNKLSKSLSSKVRPIANIISPSVKLYEPGPLLTNHEKVDGCKQATMPPTVTYRGYKLAAVDNTFSNLGFAGVRGRCSEFPRTHFIVGGEVNFFGERTVGLDGWGLNVNFRWFCGG